ncbi:MAG TPA: peptidase dimerization domain-containing protein, partial [Minicystis sp.]|nr:peptidase dimerization domain-containing protein [Minicystis sp.]
SANHEAVRWAARALAFAEEQESARYGELAGVRFNLGVLSGGTKANMIASSTELRFGVRPLPDQDPETLVRAFTDLAPRPGRVDWELGFVAPSLPGPSRSAEPARALAASLGLPPGAPVDFWTEAALFSDAGVPSIVYGPGDIREAHTSGESVALATLAEAFETYARLFASA